MKTNHTLHLGITLAGMLALTVPVSTRADTFGSGANTFTIDFVNIGDPGNPLDTGTTGLYSSPYGAVGYTYLMGTYEVSESMIDKANTVGGLFITKDTRTSVNQPATSVSWNEAARFVNWLNTSQGYAVAYKFTLNPGDAGYVSNAQANADLVLWMPGDAGYDAGNLYRNTNARYVLPGEDEWYKTAFYSGSGTTYYDYATAGDTLPTQVASGTAPGTAVYNLASVVPAVITQAGGLSHYGTMGQDGNVYEWDESAFAAPNDVASENRTVRGGDWLNSGNFLRSSSRNNSSPATSGVNVGFRVASVPEPSTWAILAAGAGSLLGFRRRSSSSS